MSTVQLFGFELPYFFAFVLFCATWIVLGWIIKRVFFVGLKKLTTKTQTDLDDIFIEAANFPVMMLVTVAGIGTAFKLFVPLPYQSRLTPFVPITLKVLALFSVVIFVDRFTRNLIHAYSEHVDILRVSHGLIKAISRIMIYFIGALIILDSIGISVTPIIASLGIGSLAIALALQPTLENLFSGFQIIIDQPVKPGDFIRLESGEEGYVERVGWRSTWIHQLPNNMVIIPNKLLVNSRVLNFYYPSKEMALPVDVGVHYNSNLEHVEEIAIAVASEVLKTTPGGVKEFVPIVRFHTFSDSSINMTVILRVNEFVDSGLVRHEFVKALARRFKKEGIVIPYPVRALNTEQEKAVLK